MEKLTIASLALALKCTCAKIEYLDYTAHRFSQIRSFEDFLTDVIEHKTDGEEITFKSILSHIWKKTFDTEIYNVIQLLKVPIKHQGWITSQAFKISGIEYNGINTKFWVGDTVIHNREELIKKLEKLVNTLLSVAKN
jgi:hypothetical protein